MLLLFLRFCFASSGLAWLLPSPLSACTLLLFFPISNGQGDTEKLAIFGRKRGRRGAELKVMAAVETKVPGYFTDKMTIGETENDSDGFGTKTLILKVRAVPRKLKSVILLVWWFPASSRWLGLSFTADHNAFTTDPPF